MINRNHLALFHAVVEEGGFGLAARKLRISQPAVSIQIGQLEETVGVRLFDRLGRGIRLTSAGRILAGYAKRIAAIEAEANEALSEIATVKGGHLRVGASTTIGAYLLPQLMGQFRKEWPDVALSMTLGNTCSIQQQLMDGIIDIGLVEGKQINPLLKLQAFRDDQLVPMVAWGHPLLRMDKPGLVDFLNYPLVLREVGSGTRESVLEYIAGQGYDLPELLEFGSNEAVKGAVAAGLGVSFVSSLAIPGDVMLRRLVVAKLADVKAIRRPLFVIQTQGRKPLPAVTAFLSVLRRRPALGGD